MTSRSFGPACFASVALVGLAACTSVLAPVLKPNVTTDVVKLEGGNWQLDPAHAALTFKIDHLGYSTYIANDEFAETLMGADWFNAANFPEARFQSTRIVMTSETTADVEGILTLHGKNAPVTLAVAFNGAGFDRLRNAQVAGFSATTEIDRTVFGISRFGGLITDMVRVEIEAELLKTPGVT